MEARRVRGEERGAREEAKKGVSYRGSVGAQRTTRDDHDFVYTCLVPQLHFGWGKGGGCQVVVEIDS